MESDEYEKFKKINDFLVSVTGNDSAQIEIPYDRETILVHMDGKRLPLESLGTGIHEVIIMASAATIVQKSVICLEEPELHLNPILQKKLLKYLESKTDNQYFISTHSAAFMDVGISNIYHINLMDGVSVVSHATSDSGRSNVCQDLGYHPSDLLQANCIIWVEGPSDRLYVNWWIQGVRSDLVEGVQYSVMFYGGRLASHLSGNDLDNFQPDFVPLIRLNRRSAIMIDSDKSKSGQKINATKKRLRDEFKGNEGLAWITKGREVENYVNSEQLKEAISAISPKSKLSTSMSSYDNCLSVTVSGKEKVLPKVEVARYVTSNYGCDLDILDLRARVKELIEFIDASNPEMHFD
jgi:hypothetical protein